MKLNEMNEEIAAACDMRAKSVAMVQKETFRRLRAVIEKGERVLIPGFGVFSTKERPATEGAEASKIVRFKISREEPSADPSPEERQAKKQAKKAKKAASAEGEAGGDSADAAGASSAEPR